MSADLVDHLPASDAQDRHQVTALARGLRILRCFSHDRPELTAAEVVRMTGLPQPTVWRLCRTLEAEGFIVSAGPGGRMTLGLPALSVGYAALARHSLPQLARPYMQAITDRYRLGTSLAMREGLDMLYLERTHGDFAFMNDPVGTRRPIATATTGWACLAGYDEDERALVLKGLKRQQGAAWPSTERLLQTAFRQYAEHGFVLSLGVVHEHLNAVAVPVRTQGTGNVYGLSAAGLASAWPSERLIEISGELLALAAQLTTIPT